MMNLKIFLLLITLLKVNYPNGHSTEDKILGKWIAAEDKNVIVSVYKESGEYRAKVLWFNDSDDPNQPMNIRKDIHNPNETLRNQKVLGMDVLKNLKYNPESNRWEGGLIYDPKTGREWSSVVSLQNDGELKVKGYWHFEFLCKTMIFKKVE
ncbi:DUF2147 domain-containing protein [Pelobium sp.]|nr:DUF2147 domain-containing protein [Pelobium sp.]MDA9555688.1 DUF2147 domain-containing protein [Pelobium sp.]